MFIHQREHETRFYEESLKFAESGFASVNDTQIHGSLLVVMQLLKHPAALEESETDAKTADVLAANLRKSMLTNFQKFATCILGFRTSPSPFVQGAVIALIPVLAEFDLNSGAERTFAPFVGDCVEYLMKDCIDSASSPHKKAAYKSLGDLCYTLGSAGAIMPHLLDDIITKIFFVFVANTEEQHPDNDAALQSLGMIFKAAAVSESRKLFPQLEK
jgi:hypothetical protein